jgi:hypothetical protein
MTDSDINKIPITVEVPPADVWVRNDYRDIVRRLGQVHMIRACEHQFDDDFVPLYDIETLAGYQLEAELLRELLAERDALKGFADLWYFVMDEAPREFERIVAEHQPKAWLQEAAKLRDAAMGKE